MSIAVAVPEEWRSRFFPAPAWEELRDVARRWDTEVAVPPGDPRDRRTFAALVRTADVVITGWDVPRLDATILAGAPRLRLLAHTGASVRPYVSAASWERGIRVTQAGEAMARPVAESCLALTLGLLHRVNRFDHALRRGRRWQAAKDAPDRHELGGCPVGVVGASRTGRAYIAMLTALGADVRVHDPYLTDAGAAALGVRRAALDTLLAGSRVVALHAPALPETRHLLGARELGLLADGALLVNTARSWLVDEVALLNELRTGRIDAGLDVFDAEPLPARHPFRRLPNVMLTPHEAGGTIEGRARAGRLLIGEIDAFFAGRPLRHEVTAGDLSRMG